MRRSLKRRAPRSDDCRQADDGRHVNPAGHAPTRCETCSATSHTAREDDRAARDAGEDAHGQGPRPEHDPRAGAHDRVHERAAADEDQAESGELHRNRPGARPRAVNCGSSTTSTSSPFGFSPLTPTPCTRRIQDRVSVCAAGGRPGRPTRPARRPRAARRRRLTQRPAADHRRLPEDAHPDVRQVRCGREGEADEHPWHGRQRSADAHGDRGHRRKVADQDPRRAPAGWCGPACPRR